MKFRAFMTDYSAMKDFMNTITTFSRLSKECVIRILSDKLYFIIPDEDGPRRPFIWCEMPIPYYFKEYNMTGVTDDSNEIYLSFSPSMFANCLSSVRTCSRSLKIKLTNKKSPCLTLEIDVVVNDYVEHRQIVHDIPVEIIPRKHWNDYSEPKFLEFHVTLQMPSVKSIRNIVERMKQMTNYLIVSANKRGRATLKIETNLVTLSAHFPNLTVHSFAEGIPSNDDSQITYIDADNKKLQLVSACIDIRKFVAFLTAMHVTNSKMLCSIVHGRMVKFVLETPGVMVLQCFLTEVSP